ncbi:Uncharacterised protein [Pragia fontium]|uniref:hypothetical protein n=1 Tax=Pragia fontium TaxID=82985 RepID=UPI000DFB094B|nr:hypothetical protein [Pragia fontium]SUB83918.1 Uncharacterised protein [Pragia fontium]
MTDSSLEKVVVENNSQAQGWGGFFTPGMMHNGQEQVTIGATMVKSGASPDEISDAFSLYVKGQIPEGQNAAEGLIVAWGNFFGMPLEAVISKGDMTLEKAASIVASGVPTSEAKVAQYVVAKAILSISERTSSGIVQSRINIANGQTRFTPTRPSTGEPVSAGFNHVLEGHFNRPTANSRSVFSITPDELKSVLQSSTVVNSPVTAIPGGQYVRTVNVGKAIGTTSLKEGGSSTTYIKIFTDKAGNLITAYPVKGK